VDIAWDSGLFSEMRIEKTPATDLEGMSINESPHREYFTPETGIVGVAEVN